MGNGTPYHIPILPTANYIGHKSLKTTQHYAKILDRKVSDDMAILKAKLIDLKSSNELKKNKKKMI